MTSQIEVIDINANNNDASVDVSGEVPIETSPANIFQPVEGVKQKEIKPKAKSNQGPRQRQIIKKK